MNLTVNGTSLYYEKSGSGSPILLLHGNGEDSTIFDAITAPLSNLHTVYKIDTRGHGKSSAVSKYSYDDMALDIIQFIQTLAIQKPMLYGFSDGGIIGLLVAIRCPTLLQGLIASGANTSPDGLEQSMLNAIQSAYEKTGDKKLKLMLDEPHITPAQLQKIKIPVLLLAGRDDIIVPAHLQEMAAQIASCRLLILEGETHDSYVTNSSKLLPYIEAFCKEAKK